MDRHTLYGIGWRLADIVVVRMAGVIGMVWRFFLFLLEFNRRWMAMALQVMLLVQLVALLVVGGTDHTGLVLQGVTFLLATLALRLAVPAIARVGHRIAVAFWHWRATSLLPRTVV